MGKFYFAQIWLANLVHIHNMNVIAAAVVVVVVVYMLWKSGMYSG